MSTTQRVVRKQLAGAEDLLQGVGIVTQTRGGGTYDIHKLDVPIPMTSIAEMQASSAEFVRLYWSNTRYTDFRRNPEGTTGITSILGGTWEEVGDSLKLRELLTKQFAAVGITVAEGSFEQGVTGVTKGTGVYQEATGKVFQWQLTNTFNVSAGSTPTNIGTDWIDTSGLLISDKLIGCVNLYEFMSSSEKVDSALLNPTLDYTDTINSAFLYASNNNKKLIIDAYTTVRITNPLNTVASLNLQLDGEIQCDMNDVSCVYVAGSYFSLTGNGTFNGLGNNIRRFIRSPYVDGQTNNYFYVNGVGGKLTFKNAASLLFHRSIDIYDDGVEFDVKSVKFDTISAVTNGTIGDLNGSCRGLYVGGSTSATTKSTGKIDDIYIKNLLPFEDGDGVQVQSNNTGNFNISISNIVGYNVAKRVVKIQANGISVNNILARAEANTQSMYAVVSMYGSGSVNNVFGVGKIMNGIDAFNTSGETVINNVNIQSTQTENEQQACVVAAGGTIKVDGVYGYGCFYSVFARSSSAAGKHTISNVYHKSVNYAIRAYGDTAYSLDYVSVSNAEVDSTSTSIPIIYSSGTIGKVKLRGITCLNTYYYAVDMSHTGLIDIDGITVPSTISHGVQIESTVTGGLLSNIRVGAAVATAAIVKCANLVISNIIGGTYSTLRFDGVAATGNKANGLVTGSGSTRSWEQINSAAGNIVTGTTPKVYTATYDPASIATGATLTVGFSVAGARLGNRVQVTLSTSALGVIISGYVSGTDSVIVCLSNLTGAAVDIPSSTLTIYVYD